MEITGLSFACPARTGRGTRFCTVSCKINNSWLNWNRFHRSSRIHFVCCCAGLPSMGGMKKGIETKQVWIWTQSRQVMTAAVERGWNTFVFSSVDRNLATDWSSIALIQTFFIEDGLLLDSDHKIIATFREVSSPQQLQELQPDSQKGLKNVIIDLLDWQVRCGNGDIAIIAIALSSILSLQMRKFGLKLNIFKTQTIIPAENIVAAFQGTDQTVFSVAKSPSEAQIFLEALEQGLGGLVLKVESVEAIIELKGYFDRRNDIRLRLGLTTFCVTKIQAAGIGDRVCVDLCSLMQPGEGLLVGSFARGLFLVHSECLESSYIASRPFRVNAGPVHSYVAIPGGKTCYLSELETGREVIIVNQDGSQRTAIVGRVKIESRPLILIEAKDTSHESTTYCILLQNAETVGLVCPQGAAKRTAIPVTALEIGDEVMLRVQGGARHTGIEIQEFIIEK